MSNTLPIGTFARQPKVRPELRDGVDRDDEILSTGGKDSEVRAVVKSKRQRRSQLEKEAVNQNSSDPSV